MTLISFESVGRLDGERRALYLDSESIGSIEPVPNFEGGQACLLGVKGGNSYTVIGDPEIIAERLHPKPRRTERVRAFFNSSLGIFCLSAIFVSGGGALWKWSTQEYSEYQARLARERLLLVEFDSRVSEMNSRARQIDDFKTDQQKGSATLCIIHLAGGTGICSIQNKPTLPLVDIVNELRGLGVRAEPSAVFTTLGDIEAENGEVVKVVNSAEVRVYPDGLLSKRLGILSAYSAEAWKQVGRRY